MVAHRVVDRRRGDVTDCAGRRRSRQVRVSRGLLPCLFL